MKLLSNRLIEGIWLPPLWQLPTPALNRVSLVKYFGNSS